MFTFINDFRRKLGFSVPSFLLKTPANSALPQKTLGFSRLCRAGAGERGRCLPTQVDQKWIKV
jgi:hypothetical protein